MATSRLQIEFGNLLDKTFPELTITENFRPDWLLCSSLTKLELDFYIAELQIAFEIQGRQHLEFVPFFHKTLHDFERQKERDIEKKNLCYGHGVSLIEIFSMMDGITEVNKIKEMRARSENLYIIPPEVEILKQARYIKRKEASAIVPVSSVIDPDKQKRANEAKEKAARERQEKILRFGEIGYDLRCFRKKAKKHIGVPFNFRSAHIPEDIYASIWQAIPTLKTPEEIDRFFGYISDAIEL